MLFSVILRGPFFSFENSKNAKIGVLIKKHLYLIAFVDVPISQTGLNYSPISLFFRKSTVGVCKYTVIQNNRFCSCLGLLVWKTTAFSIKGFIES